MLQSKLNDAGFGEPHWYGNTAAPSAPTAARAEYDGLVQEFYSRTGKLDQAQDLAFQQIQKTWRPTTINGDKEVMKFGPSPDEVPVIRDGIAQTAKALGLKDDPATIKLTPFGGTNLSQGRYWNLTHENGDLVLDDKNQPVTIDTSKGRPAYADRLAKQQAADKASAIAKAQMERGIQQTADLNPPTGAGN